jgi:hypothetical protein
MQGREKLPNVTRWPIDLKERVQKAALALEYCERRKAQGSYNDTLAALALKAREVLDDARDAYIEKYHEWIYD